MRLINVDIYFIPVQILLSNHTFNTNVQLIFFHQYLHKQRIYCCPCHINHRKPPQESLYLFIIHSFFHSILN